jgi:uncharacterized membrane protein
MTQSEKRAILTLVIWGLVAVGFAALFFGDGGPVTFGADKGRIVSTAILIGVGFAAYFIMLYLTRSRPGATRVVVDERDVRIASRANAGTLIVVLVVVYLACISLWSAYQDGGCVPVGWLWFLGYAAAILGYLTHAAATLLLNHGMDDHGQG